jgi:hypothetical protein
MRSALWRHGLYNTVSSTKYGRKSASREVCLASERLYISLCTGHSLQPKLLSMDRWRVLEIMWTVIPRQSAEEIIHRAHMFTQTDFNFSLPDSTYIPVILLVLHLSP